MTEREKDEADLTRLLRGKHIRITNVDDSIYNGMCHGVALWDGMVILHVHNRRFEFTLEELPQHVKLLINGTGTTK